MGERRTSTRRGRGATILAILCLIATIPLGLVMSGWGVRELPAQGIRIEIPKTIVVTDADGVEQVLTRDSAAGWIPFARGATRFDTISATSAVTSTLTMSSSEESWTAIGLERATYGESYAFIDASASYYAEEPGFLPETVDDQGWRSAVMTTSPIRLAVSDDAVRAIAPRRSVRVGEAVAPAWSVQFDLAAAYEQGRTTLEHPLEWYADNTMRDFRTYAPWWFGLAISLAIVLFLRAAVLRARDVEARHPREDGEGRMPTETRAAVAAVSAKMRIVALVGVVAGAAMLISGIAILVTGIVPREPEDGVAMEVPKTFTVTMADGSRTTMRVMWPSPSVQAEGNTQFIALDDSIDWADDPAASTSIELDRYGHGATVQWLYEAETAGVLPEEPGEEGAVVASPERRGTMVTVDDPTISGIAMGNQGDEGRGSRSGSVWAVSFDRLAATEHGRLDIDHPLWMYQSPFSGLLAAAPALLIAFGGLILVDGMLLHDHHSKRRDRAALEVRS